MGNGPYRKPPQERVEYLVVFGCDAQGISKDLTRYAEDGYRVIPGGTGTGGYDRGLYVLMQRTTTT